MSIYSPLLVLIEDLIDLLEGSVALGIELLEDIADFLGYCR
jgi:hypothetical protein